MTSSHLSRPCLVGLDLVCSDKFKFELKFNELVKYFIYFTITANIFVCSRLEFSKLKKRHMSYKQLKFCYLLKLKFRLCNN